ncbi:MAG: preprotein translocase subunit SecE [Solirubrobacteraceae bacterium]
MARDRQRSKARQRARATGQRPAGKRARSQARDIGLDDPGIDETGLTDDTPAPDPLKNISPDVDQAHAAETGALRGPAGDEVDLQPDDEDDRGERAPDELEIPADLVPGRGGGGGRRGGADDGLESELPHDPDRKDRGRVLTFLRACVDELGRVQWPDRRHVLQATAVVLGFVVIAGAWLGLMDAIWQPLINAIL